MSADPRARAAAIDLDDAEGLIAADREGLLRAASMAGAQVRSTAAALDEGALDPLRSDMPPRTVIWVASRGPAETAGLVLAAALGGSTAAPIVVAPEVPAWVGALDVLVVAGDDALDPVLVSAAATGVRRGARVIVVAPDEGPLQDVTAGRAVVLAPRLQVPDGFAFVRYFAAGLATLRVVDPGMQVDIAALADELDAEALGNSAGRELFTNPAKTLADRMCGRDVVVAGDNAATLALARHAGAVLLRVGHQPVAAVGLADLAVALRGGIASGADDYETSLYHDEELDGPLPTRLRALVLAVDDERSAIAAKVSGYEGIVVVSAEDVPDVPTPTGRRLEQQLATLALRLEMAAVYLRLVRG
ncbi:TobH protein [Mycobacterium sp. URHB0044]|uniref:TobH protein n=1 Tax=Mycobacterium sp. URHB0044 TaxID=1380386 RepID=UPI00048C59AB|nr:TobH protein [Mycobacterium sp. URHB0044]